MRVARAAVDAIYRAKDHTVYEAGSSAALLCKYVKPVT